MQVPSVWCSGSHDSGSVVKACGAPELRWGLGLHQEPIVWSQEPAACNME